MPPVLIIICIVIISKVVISEVILSIVIVSITFTSAAKAIIDSMSPRIGLNKLECS